MKIKALHFVCPECQNHVKADCAIWEGGELRLVADCEGCGEKHVRFSCDRLCAKLLELNYSKGNEQVN